MVSEIEPETINDVHFSLSTIQRRSNSLLEFVDSYRQVTRVPNPIIQEVEIKPLFQSVAILLQSELAPINLTIETSA